MTDARISQATVRALGDGSDAQVSQGIVRSIFNYPAEYALVSQAVLRSFDVATPDARVSQAVVRVLYRIDEPTPEIRVWTFTLDGHDYYVLRLGGAETLVYDTYSKRWSNWGTGTSSRWRDRMGCNWPGAVGVSPATQVVTGDEIYGTLYFLDPDYPYDDDPISGDANPQPFRRMAQGQVVNRGRTPIDCFGVSLTGSFGDTYDTSLTDVTLAYSDDAGKNYTDAGTLTVPPYDYAARAEWPSLGLIYSPGRMFLITDEGSLARIDSLDMFDPQGEA